MIACNGHYSPSLLTLIDFDQQVPSTTGTTAREMLVVPFGKPAAPWKSGASAPRTASRRCGFSPSGRICVYYRMEQAFQSCIKCRYFHWALAPEVPSHSAVTSRPILFWHPSPPSPMIIRVRRNLNSARRSHRGSLWRETSQTTRAARHRARRHLQHYQNQHAHVARPRGRTL